MPEPRRDPPVGGIDPAPPVAGTVRLMTDEPLEVPSGGAAIGQRFAALINRRPWIVPAALLGIGVVFLALRRKR